MKTNHVEDQSMTPATWHGTTAEFARLENALERHCECHTRQDRSGTTLDLCPPHEMLRDQRTLDHLLFAYRARVRFEDGEWRVSVTSQHVVSNRAPGESD